MRMSEFVVPSELWRNHVRGQSEAVDEAVWLIEHVCGHLDVPDLSELTVLDIGCGTRFAQAFAARGVPVKTYVGVDVSAPVIELLRENIAKPGFEFHHLNAWNDRYNRAGLSLADVTLECLEGRQFDVIWLFSVFTHLAPADYVAMLRLLRPHIAPQGRLFYSLFINERTEGGYGFADNVARVLAERRETDSEALQSEEPEPPPFQDADPSRPLWVALYSRQHALDLIAGTDWKVVSVSPPIHHLQHHILARPG
jgi:SAM-dependent methyltransferase